MREPASATPEITVPLASAREMMPSPPIVLITGAAGAWVSTTTVASADTDALPAWSRKLAVSVLLPSLSAVVTVTSL